MALPPHFDDDPRSDHDKLVVIWSDHFEMKARIDRLYWMLPFVSFLSIIVGAVGERIGKIGERIFQ